MTDLAFLKDAAVLGLEVNPLSGEDVQQLVANLFDFPPEVKKRAKKIIYSK